MANKFVTPSLADLSQDIVGDIPLDLLAHWNGSKQDLETHTRLLQPFEKSGTVVSSDASGLSKLSKEKHILEVLKLVSEPKEIIFKHGKSVGGQAVGTWVADNTQMFYPKNIETSTICWAMSCAMTEIKQTCQVQVGMAIHPGKYTNLGGGLFGHDANLIEEIAENQTKPGQILLIDKDNYVDVFDGSAQANSIQVDENLQYPIPFDPSFYEKLKLSYDMESYFHKTFVILIKITHKQNVLLLQQLTNWALANAIVKKMGGETKVREIKSNGLLGIFTSLNKNEAIKFAKQAQEALQMANFSCSVGISFGEVLIFPMKTGFEIAGEPVNIASKLAEDVGEIGKIYVHNIELPGKKFEYLVSGINLTGVVV